MRERNPQSILDPEAHVEGAHRGTHGLSPPDYPFWAFRLWHGMTLSVWLGLLRRHRFAVSPRRSFLVLDVTLAALINSVLARLQRLIYGRRIARTPIAAPPVFIIGHWRTGTTWLHEMLALDARFVVPTTYECVVPAHALLTWPLRRLADSRVPESRPMDAVLLSTAKPQEDEIAIMNSGAGSFFETFAFPNHRPAGAEFIDLTSLTGAQLDRWKATRIAFLKQVLLRAELHAERREDASPQRQLLLKSPPDVARLGVLNDMFPGACYIHLVRNPEDVFGSTVRLWTTLGASQACQVPDWRALPHGTPSLEEFVLSTFERVYRNFAQSRSQVADRQFIELRYEDLVRAPATEIERIYAHFGWSGFAALRSRIEAYIAAGKPHRPTRHDIPDSAKAAVATRWADYRQRYGYGC